VHGTISTLAPQQATETLQGELQGLKTLCEELGSTKVNLADLQAASKTWKEVQEISNARIVELQEKASAIQGDLQDHAKQLADHAASSRVVQDELAMKAGRQDTEKLYSDLQQLQQQAETFATVERVEKVSQDIKQVQQGLNEAVGKIQNDAAIASEGSSVASAELTAALEAQKMHQAEAEQRITSMQKSLQQLQTHVESSRTEGEQSVSTPNDHGQQLHRSGMRIHQSGMSCQDNHWKYLESADLYVQIDLKAVYSA
jgi:chromosome segregation ATPase